MSDKKAHKYSKRFLNETIQVWQPYCPQKLTDNDAVEIADNVCRLFRFLNKLDRKYNKDG